MAKTLRHILGRPTRHSGGYREKHACGQTFPEIRAGRNNQTYSKFCEVKPENVDVQTKHVLYGRWKVCFRAGSHQYGANFADDRSRTPCIIDTSGFLAGAEGFVHGNGLLCNDCGLISPVEGYTHGSACKDCGRTLCHRHTWELPIFRFRRPEKTLLDLLCKREHTLTELSVQPILCSYLKTATLGILPGLLQLLMKQYMLSAVLLTLLLCASVAAFFHFPESLFLLVMFNIAESIHWTRRIRLHKNNLERLSKYRPEWE